jgi:hypothetical protein
MNQVSPEVEKFRPLKGVQFELSETQVARLNEWLAGIHQRAIEIQLTDLARMTPEEREERQPDRVPYYGAGGGGLTFTFTPTGLGVICRVSEYITEEVIDLSEIG